MSSSTAADRTDETERVIVDVDGIAHGGEGVGRLPSGKAVFVAGAIPGERVRVRVDDERKRWARGTAVDVLDPSPHRVTPPCPYVPECGGCDLQHVAPDHQRALKTRIVREQLERIGRIDDPPVEPTRPVGPDTGYRASARFHVDAEGRLGFHRSGSHDVVPIDQCLILAEGPQALRDQVPEGTGASEVTVRARASSDERGSIPTSRPGVVAFAPGDGPLDLPEDEFDVVLLQPSDGTAVPLRGDGVLTAEIAGLTYRFDASCFFQVNTGGAEAIVAEVLAQAREHAAPGGLDQREIWDLYAGVGLLSLPLARAGALVTAVEAHERAADWCAENADVYDLDVRVVASRADTFVSRVADGMPIGDLEIVERPDVVVLDPTRAGAGTELVGDLARLEPELVIYVACDPAALARDARALTEHGYRLERALPLDLFPMTHHIEVIATFRR